jgi:PAT family beta-lactamase induction signal transducer AmpG
MSRFERLIPVLTYHDIPAAHDFLVNAFGWPEFFWMTIAAGVPGLLLLARFVPLGAREPLEDVTAHSGADA